MTREDIIRMAREAGFERLGHTDNDWVCYPEDIERFAALVASAEREMYELLQRCENEMRYSGWDKREADNTARNGVYEQVKELLEKNT